MHITKRDLGEGYMFGTSFVLAGSFLASLVLVDLQVEPWMIVGLLPPAGLVGLLYWVQTIGFDDQQVWSVAEFVAVGIGTTTIAIVGMHLFSGLLTVSTTLTVALVTTAGGAAVGGALLGVAWQLRRSEQQLTLRNSVLYRVLRHNLRNDMTVVLGHLEEVKADADEKNRREIEAAERKINALVELTDKVRQVNVAMDGSCSTTATDLVSLIERRVELVEGTYPEITITTDLPETARTYVDDQFGIVVDNVVESAIMYSDGIPELRVEVSVERDEVVLSLVDCNRSIPRSDLSAVAAGSESEMKHGCGIELWLVYWLAECHDASLSIETEPGESRIEIVLQRALDRDSVLDI